MNKTRGPNNVRILFIPQTVVLELVQSAYGSLDGAVLQRIEDVLNRLIESTAAHVIVDLTNAHYFGARMVGVLVTAHKKLRDHNRRLLLCGVTPFCRRVINALKLQNVFAVHATQADSLDALWQDGSKETLEASAMRIVMRTENVNWDSNYLRLSYFGDDSHLYSEFFRRN